VSIAVTRIDRSSVFHGQKTFKCFSEQSWKAKVQPKVAYMENDLKTKLEGLAAALFGPTGYRWVGSNFPFTDPSYELKSTFKVLGDAESFILKRF
jgi:phenylalanyl-tRNA synthetase alpha subunit